MNTVYSTVSIDKEGYSIWKPAMIIVRQSTKPLQKQNNGHYYGHAP